MTPVLLALLAGGSLGCELIAAVDRSQIDQGGGMGSGGMGGGGSGGMGGGGSGGTGGEGGAGGGACTPEDDGNPCTEDVCEGDVPTHKPTAAGTALPDQVTGDCKQAVCDGNGAATQQNDDIDLPDDMNACTDDVCTAGAPSNPPIAAGAACGQDLVCDGNGMCVGCNAPTDCAGTDDECKARTCEAGVCGVSFTPANTPAGMQTPGDCSAIVCDGSGATTTLADDTDLPPDDADPCKVPACSAGQPAVADAPDGTTCADGDACTQTDTCQAGTCTAGAGQPCQNGGTCATSGGGYVCSCPSGYSGVNCETCVPTTCEAQGATCGTIPDGCGGMLTCGPACAVCPCDPNPAWQSALAGTLVKDGRCTNYSFPGPCGSNVMGQNSFSWAVSENGMSLVELLAGTQDGQFGLESYCGVQVMQPSSPTSCSGGSFPVIMTITAAEGAACRTKVLNFGAAQGGVCQ
ncbi:calcium-binding EGF-like domain-containing protein [Polyangium sorediatum]|uniref:Calcium-binding EGF-like domain-containing protein n=1 Tax=Polyangium sorediatum TaxID=889274 RepID=A0ABT6NWD8_9BACT|nr:calcium-binding EGF-like domain-containing protein [Polyangium sorediatum]MDI1432624.1 calcium-binding EGF-like domain-containing protein [Polyangium sorediatum]